MYKLIAIDLDGTLLNSYGEVSSQNKEAIKKAIDRGIYVVLCSGRIGSSVENLANEVGASSYLIGGNGALVWDREKKEKLYNKFMDKDLALKIIQVCEENSIYYSIMAEGSIIAKNLRYNVLFYNSENASKPAEKKTKINLTQDVYNYIKSASFNEFSKITICDSNKVIFDSIIHRLRKINNIEVLDVAHMSRKKIKNGTEDAEVSYFYTEVTKKNVNKWNAIQFLINKLGIKPEEVMAIGDNTNDKEMILNAGLGVVMGNSAPHIKELGDIIVATNDENGVAEAIENYALNG